MLKGHPVQDIQKVVGDMKLKLRREAMAGYTDVVIICIEMTVQSMRIDKIIK